jgi:hypothetical protein
MTLLIEGLFSYLSTANTAAGSRIYPKRLPQTPTLPAITYFEVSDPPEHTHSGPSKLRHPRYQLGCWAADYIGSKSLAEEVKTKIEGYSGSMGGVTVNVSLIEDGGDNEDPDTGRWWVNLDVIIWHQKP